MTIFCDNYLLDYILVFLGLRFCLSKKQKKVKKGTFARIVRRNIISKRLTHPESQRQPRRLVRDMYRNFYHRDLSPDQDNRIIRSDSDKSDDNGNIERKVKLNIGMSRSKKIFNKVCNFIQNNYRLTLSWLYSGSIIALLSIQPIYGLYHLIDRVDDNVNFYRASLFFNLIPVSQYILALAYFNTSHFEDFFLSKEYIDPKCFPSLNTIIILIILITIVLNIISQFIILGQFSLERSDSEFPDFSSFSYSNLILAFLWVIWVYGRITLFLNLTVFTLIFCKHCAILSGYVKKLKKNCRVNALTINKITQEVLNIRYNLEQSIDMFKNIFSLFTLFGTIGFGFFLERIQNGNFELFPWHQLVIYLVTQIVFVVMVYRVSQNKDSLSDYIRQPVFIDKFLKRYSPIEIRQKFGENMDLISLNIQEENASTLDWMVLNDIFNEEWTEFKVMGIDISDGALIKKSLVFVTLVVTVNNLIK